MARDFRREPAWPGRTSQTDTPADDRHPAFVQIKDGTVLCSFFIYLGDEPAITNPGQIPDPHVFFLRSLDGGQTWEKTPIPLGTPHFHETDGPLVQLKDGSVLAAINGRPEGPPDQAGLFRFTDGG